MQRIDSRIKLCCIGALIICAVASKTISSLLILFGLILILCIFSKIPFSYFFARTSIFIPFFAGIIAIPLIFIEPGKPLFAIDFPVTAQITMEGVYKASLFTIRVWVCVAFMTLMVLTTKFPELLHALQSLRVPKIFITLTSVTYRFIFLFIDEAYRLVLAREGRTIRKQRWRDSLRSLSNLITTLFIRAHERGELLYLAMIARGYNGSIIGKNKMRFVRSDWIFAICMLLTILSVIAFEQIYLGGI